jgi:large subunit ribosomal protein L5
MQVPRPVKVVINMGLGRAPNNPKLLDAACADLEAITGQKAVKTRARKSVSNFKLRQGMEIGASVTLRDRRMWEFLDRFVNVSLPRIRDFRGLPARLSGSGDYTMGLKDQLIFPEINYDKVDEPRGMNVTIVTTAGNDEEGRELLRLLGMPFRR